MVLGHHCADAVAEEPRRLVGHAQHFAQIDRADALRRGDDEVDGLRLGQQGEVGEMHGCAHRHAELTGADTIFLTPHGLEPVGAIDSATERADWTIRPAGTLEPCPRRHLVGEQVI